jgi:hypothetical protein
MPAPSRNVAHSVPPPRGQRLRLRAHPRREAWGRNIVFFGLGVLVGLSLMLVAVASGWMPEWTGQSAARPGDLVIGRLGGKGCVKRTFDNQSGQVTEESCDTTSYDPDKVHPSPDRVNAVRRWFKP